MKFNFYSFTIFFYNKIIPAKTLIPRSIPINQNIITKIISKNQTSNALKNPILKKYMYITSIIRNATIPPIIGNSVFIIRTTNPAKMFIIMVFQSLVFPPRNLTAK